MSTLACAEADPRTARERLNLARCKAAKPKKKEGYWLFKTDAGFEWVLPQAIMEWLRGLPLIERFTPLATIPIIKNGALVEYWVVLPTDKH